MATLTIRNLDEDLKKLLRIRAAKQDCSMEEEARRILRKALRTDRPVDLGRSIHHGFADLGGVEVELPARGTTRPRPNFTDAYEREKGN